LGADWDFDPHAQNTPNPNLRLARIGRCFQTLNLRLITRPALCQSKNVQACLVIYIIPRRALAKVCRSQTCLEMILKYHNPPGDINKIPGPAWRLQSMLT
ncbi:MAG: hypothetical protein ACO4AV_15600, partial [bacterium]